MLSGNIRVEHVAAEMSKFGHDVVGRLVLGAETMCLDNLISAMWLFEKIDITQRWRVRCRELLSFPELTT